MKSPSSKDAIFQIWKIKQDYFLKDKTLKVFISPFSGEINMDGIIECYSKKVKSKTISALHSHFVNFKQILGFKRLQRKTKIDSVLKKCKSKFVKTVQEATSVLIKEKFTLPKLPQSFTVNINIRANKQYLNVSLRQIYEKFNSDFDYNLIIKSLVMEKRASFAKLLSSTYAELFNQFIKSERFKEDCESIKEKEGEKFQLLYLYVSKVYISYYSMSKGNITRELNSQNGDCKLKLLNRAKRFCVIKNSSTED